MNPYFDELAVYQAKYSCGFNLLFSPFATFANHCLAPSLETFSRFEIPFSSFFDKFFVWIPSLEEESAEHVMSCGYRWIDSSRCCIQFAP